MSWRWQRLTSHETACATGRRPSTLSLFAARAAAPASSRADPRPDPPLPLTKASLASARARPGQPAEPLSMQSSVVPLPNFQFARRCLCLRGRLPVRSSQALERSCLRGDRTHKPDQRRHRAAPGYQPRLFWDVTPHFSKFLPGAQGHAHAPGQGRRCCPGSPSVGSCDRNSTRDSAVGLIWPRTPVGELKKSKKPVWRVARNLALNR